MAEGQSEDRAAALRLSQASKASRRSMKSYAGAAEDRRMRELERAAKERERRDGFSFNKEVFSVLAGRATDLEWFMFETRVR